MSYRQFDVVVVPFPFTDVTTTKKRPALVLSDKKNFNTSVKKSVMAMITTASHSQWSLDTLIHDLSSAGLKTASIVRMKLFTLDDALVLKTIGSLSELDRIAVTTALRNLFKF